MQFWAGCVVMGIRHKIRSVPFSQTPMRTNYILAPLTIVLLVVAVVNVVNKLQARKSEGESTAEAERSLNVTSEDSESSIIAQSTSLLMTGVSSKIPQVEDYALLSTVPWEFKEINRLFRSAGTEHACQLLETGLEVVQPLGRGMKGQATPLGRRSAFGLRLQLGKELGNGLPGISRGYIEDYLKAHQLMVQPSFYQDENGKLILGPELRAALYKIEGPFLTALQEDMIKTSVGDLRTLGAYWQKEKDFSPSAVRTLILAFHYERDSDKGTTQPTPQHEFELIFLHLLPDAAPEMPRLAVFATSDGRSQFHLLEETDPDRPEEPASVTADIRFADVQLLGMLPRLPVVTRVKHRSLLTLPIEMVKAEVAGLPGKPPEDGLSTVLDEFYARAIGVDVESPAADRDATVGEAASGLTETTDGEKAEAGDTKAPSDTSLPTDAGEDKDSKDGKDSEGSSRNPAKKKKSGKPSFDA